MSHRRYWIAAGALAMLLTLPRAGAAGIIEIIAEMSGPQMIGFPFECRLGVSRQGTSLEFCHWFVPLVGSPNRETKTWLTLEGGPYFSTGVGTNADLYETGDVFMLTFDPMIERVSLGSAVGGVYHGAGLTANFLFGNRFRRFGNVGFKFRPAGFIIPIGSRGTLDLSYNLRIYPRRFTADDFDVPGTPEDGVEFVHAGVIALRF
jgi:hypothetical protein